MKYLALAQTYEQLAATNRRLEKTDILTTLLNETPSEDLPQITLLIQGKVFPAHDDRKIGIAAKLVQKALNLATGTPTEKIIQLHKKLGDLGDVAKEVTKTKQQATLFSQELTVKKVFENIQKLTTIEGAGSVDTKLKTIAELLTSAKPLEAKFIARTLLEDLRVGVGDGTLRDAIANTFLEGNVEPIQRALDLTNDFGQVAIAAKKGIKELEKIKLTAQTPIKLMLFQKAKGFDDALETVGVPCAIEYKYDGFRVQIHKKENEINLYTRGLEEVTKQFPDVVQAAQSIKAKNAIIDAEIIGIKSDGNYLPFQQISQRIRRKHDIEELVKKLPVVIRAFDIMEVDGQNLLQIPFKERRSHLEKILPKTKSFHPAEQLLTSSPKEAAQFYQQALVKGNEGVMVKKLDAPYKPGSRVGSGLKIKPTMETLDLAIVKAEWGEGKRSQWLSSFTLACEDNGDFKEIGKVGTGFKEKDEEGLSFNQLTKLLKPLITKETGKTVQVKPKIILEIEYEEIQSSPSYESGFALRFPRVIRLREDKDEVSTLELVEQLYDEQKKS